MKTVLRSIAQFFFGSLSKQFILLSFFLIGIFGYIVFSVLNSLESIYTDLVYRSMNGLADSKIKALESYILDCYEDVYTLAKQTRYTATDAYPTFSRYINNRKGDFLRQYRDGRPSIVEIMVLDLNGNVIYENRYKRSRGQNKKDRSWFVRALGHTNASVTTGLFKSGGTTPYFIISHAVMDQKKDVIGVVAGVFNVKPMIAIISGEVLGGETNQYVINRETQTIVLHPNLNRLGETVRHDDINALIKSGATSIRTYQSYNGEREMTVLGARRFMSAQIDPKFKDWVYVVERDYGDVMDVMKLPRTLLYQILIVAVIGLVVIIYIFSLVTIQPIKKLNEAAHALAQGDLKKRIKFSRIDEIGRLGQSFNYMANELQMIYTRLQHKIKLTREELLETDNELQRKQEQLIRSAKLAAMGKLTAGIAHEIRNPLQSIKLFVQRRGNRKGVSAKEAKDIDLIAREISRIEDQINQFVDFARPEKPRFKATSIRPVIENTISLLSGRFKQKKIDCQFKAPRNLKQVNIDEKKMGQVFMNLFLNAVDAMKTKGKLDIRARIATRNKKEYVHISVSDNGSGIKENDIPYIFDPFVTGKEKGTGLGLSIVYSIIETHQGDIEVESAYQKGTTFHIYLPPAKKR